MHKWNWPCRFESKSNSQDHAWETSQDLHIKIIAYRAVGSKNFQNWLKMTDPQIDSKCKRYRLIPDSIAMAVSNTRTEKMIL